MVLHASLPRRVSRWLAAPACALLVAGVSAGPASAATLSAANGHLSAFSSRSVIGGSLRAVAGGAGGDASAFGATVTGRSDLDIARGNLSVSWPQGSQATWGASFDLPSRYHTAARGNVALMRWDDYTAGSRAWDEDLVEVNVATNRATLVHVAVSGSTVKQTRLVGPFTLPTNAWFTLQVKQTLRSGAGAASSVYLNGRPVGSSSQPNLLAHAVAVVRYGLVVVSDGAEHGQTTLRFDRASASGTLPAAAATGGATKTTTSGSGTGTTTATTTGSTTGTTTGTTTGSTTGTTTGTTTGSTTGTTTTSTSPVSATPGTVLAALAARADAVTAADYPYVYGGGHPHAGTPSIGIPGSGYDGKTVGYDCSGSVAAVLSGAGLWTPGASVPTDAGVISQLAAEKLIVAGQGTGPEEVTLFDDPGVHIFMRMDGHYFGTSDGAGGNRSQPHGGAGWLNDSAPDASSPAFKPYHFPVAELDAAFASAALKAGASPLA